MTLEICAYTIGSALAAARGGASRIELCSNPSEGGTTPSAGMIEQARSIPGLRLHVLIRPRGGNFVYSPEEFAVMKQDILYCRSQGVDGIVTGILTPGSEIDVPRMQELVSLLRPMSLTFHRAFDLCPDPLESLRALKELGAERILTSGKAAVAAEGIPLIRELVSRAGGTPLVMPGGGITGENLEQLALETGAREFHASVSVKTAPGHHPEENSQPWKEPFVSWMETDPARVRSLKNILDRIS